MGKRGFSKRLNPTAWVRALRCNTVYITRYRSMRVPVSIRTSYFMADKKALVDSGATDNFMHPAFAKRMGLGLQELPTPKKIFNIDNTSNKSGMITHFLDLNVQTNGINKEMRFLVTDIGHEELLLGYPWLAVTNLQGLPSGRTQSDKIRDLKSLVKQFARDQGSCDDTRISYLEYVESEAEADWTLARMIAG
jgi:hypothetical protein